MRLLHFVNDTDEYVVLVEGDEDAEDFSRQDYKLSSDSEIEFPDGDPGNLPTEYTLQRQR